MRRIEICYDTISVGASFGIDPPKPYSLPGPRAGAFITRPPAAL